MKIETAEQGKEFVDRVVDKVMALLKEEISQIEDKSIHWVLYGRIINLVFASFYSPTISFADKTSKELQNEN